jgi:hypothetical protein
MTLAFRGSDFYSSYLVLLLGFGHQFTHGATA